MASRLFLTRGSGGRIEAAGSGETTTVGALARHRLVYESRPLRDASTQGRTPFVKLFEIVPGARVVGRAPAGARVELHLDLQSRNGGGFVYETTTRADAEGRYEATLPYPTESFSPDIRMASHWIATVGSERASFRVPEAAVRGGALVEGPDFDGESQPIGSDSPKVRPLG
jgi:dolichyl-diphosphooligosaccharide--protein glycosyltransferase